MFQEKLFRAAALGAVVALCLTFLLGSTSDVSSASYLLQDPGDFAPVLQLEPRANIIPNQYIVVLNENPVNSRMSSAAIGQMVQSVATTHVAAEPIHTFTNSVSGFAATLTDAEVESLRSDSRVAYIEPDHIVTISADQSNPTWGLDRIDQRNLPLDDNDSQRA